MVLEEQSRLDALVLVEAAVPGMRVSVLSAGRTGPPQDPDEVRDRIPEIPTRLVLPSECDRQLLTTAAVKLVAEHRDEILEFLNRP